VPDAFLEAAKNGFLVACVQIDHSVRGETDLGQSRCEQILPCLAPQDFAACPRGDAGREKSRRGAIDRCVTAARDFVQCPKRESSTRKPGIDGFDPERQDRSNAKRPTFEELDLLAETSNCWRWVSNVHAFQTYLRGICSRYVLTNRRKSQSD
jgi:hypothetical protein